MARLYFTSLLVSPVKTILVTITLPLIKNTSCFITLKVLIAASFFVAVFCVFIAAINTVIVAIALVIFRYAPAIQTRKLNKISNKLQYLNNLKPNLSYIVSPTLQKLKPCNSICTKLSVNPQSIIILDCSGGKSYYA